jgi:hypothetical protein
MQIFSINGCFGAKSREIAHTKTALAAKIANFLNGLLLCIKKGPNKMGKFTILSSHAFPEK